MRRVPSRLLTLTLAATMAAGVAGCSRNPATGRLQFGLVSEDDEITLGKEANEDVLEALGVYDESAAVTGMVDQIGAEVAAQTERPDLPWTFAVLDEPTVNAFALPGGFVYVTRGLLAHLDSLDELAAVVGHEAGHVTARHGVVQLRKQRVAQRSVGVFRVVDPNLRHVGGIAARTAGLALLKYSRDDEYEADDLGLRYMERAGYDPNAVTEVFDVLSRVTKAAGGERVPPWLSTHPEPELRRDRLQARLENKGVAGGDVAADDDFLAAIDGMVFGQDPRDGFFVGATFVHPARGFSVEVPPKWKAAHNGDRVVAINEAEDALFALAPSDAPTAQEALDGFFEDGTVERGEEWAGKVRGYDTKSAAFATGPEGDRLAGLVAFVDYEGEVMSLIAIGQASTWNPKLEVVALTFASFGRIENKALRKVDPMRVAVVTLPAKMNLTEFHRTSGAVVDVETLALINAATPEQVFEAGARLKTVRGFNPALLAPPPDEVE